MANKKDQNYLLGVALTRNSEYRHWLVKDPEAAARGGRRQIGRPGNQLHPRSRSQRVSTKRQMLSNKLPSRSQSWPGAADSTLE